VACLGLAVAVGRFSDPVAAMAAEGSNDAATIRRKAIEVLYGSHTYGHPVQGTAESISQISREDIVNYHARFYLANNSVLVVTGDVKAEEVTRLARTMPARIYGAVRSTDV